MPAVEAVRIATWKVAYRGILPDDLLDAMKVEDERVRWLVSRLADGDVPTFVAVASGDVIGFATVGPSRDEDLMGRELYGIYLLPDHWSTGAGHALVEACGVLDSVWVLEGNDRARRFYEREGFALDGATKVLEHLGGAVELRYVKAGRG